MGPATRKGTTWRSEKPSTITSMQAGSRLLGGRQGQKRKMLDAGALRCWQERASSGLLDVLPAL